MGEDIVVTATRGPQPQSTAPSQVTVVPGAQIERSKALDEALRGDPAFATFRRSSSLVADPSSQGVNLRGIGPSGVSRALVLEDGVPVNDGFGGWVYWGATPRLGIERVEIAPGASSALYGSSALGGVVQVISRPIEDRGELEVQGARFGTAQGALFVARRGERFGAALDAEGLRTDGYGVVAAPGTIDHPASSRHAAARARFEAHPSEDLTLSARVSGFAEDQDGGTRYTTAAAREGLVALGIATGDLEAHAFGRWSRFDQQRASVQPGRGAEDLAGTQSAPADDEGASVQWSRGGLLLGADARRIFGRSIEVLETGPVSSRRTPGEQRLLGAFAQQIVDPLSWLRAQVALRFDSWRNLGGVRREELSAGGVAETDLPDRGDTALSPRLALRAQALPWLALRAAAYRSFRAPTLNELYRPFQVGTVRTDANPELGPETLIGAEAGFDTPWLRATAFAAGLRDPIANATLEPGHQMRENLGLRPHPRPYRRGALDPARAAAPLALVHVHRRGGDLRRSRRTSAPAGSPPSHRRRGASPRPALGHAGRRPALDLRSVRGRPEHAAPSRLRRRGRVGVARRRRAAGRLRGRGEPVRPQIPRGTAGRARHRGAAPLRPRRLARAAVLGGRVGEETARPTNQMALRESWAPARQDNCCAVALVGGSEPRA